MKTYKILSYSPAPERNLVILNINEFIEAYKDYLPESVGSTFDAVLEEWFNREYRYNDIPQGEEFYGESTWIDVEYLDNTTKRFEIPVEGKSFEDAKLDIVKSMKDYEILIEGDMDWTGGTWNTFTIILDDDNDFDAKKIKAIGEYGLIVDYTYDGEYLFESEEDCELTDGYISTQSSIFYNGSLHEIKLEDLKSDLEDKGITLDPDLVLDYLIEEIKNKEKMINFNPGIEVKSGTHWTAIYEEALLLHPENMRMAAKHLKIDYETFKEGCSYYPFLRKLWKSD